MVADAVAALHRHPPAIVAIGASAGAVQALGDLLPPLPRTFPVPITLVVHIPSDRPSALPALLAGCCALNVCEIEDKVPLEPGCLYVAAPDYHLLVEPGLLAALSADDPVCNTRPSIDVLFESIAYSCGRRAVGILLSGANADGSDGLAAMHANGAITWVQQPESAMVATMPEAALARAPHAIFDAATMGLALAEWGRARA